MKPNERGRRFDCPFLYTAFCIRLFGFGVVLAVTLAMTMSMSIAMTAAVSTCGQFSILEAR